MYPGNSHNSQRGIALLGAMVLVMLVSLLSMTLLNLSGQEVISAGAGAQAAVAQQLADGAGELAIAWFHSPQTMGHAPQLETFRVKRNSSKDGAPSFFDPSGRSQFVGTFEQPDFRVQADDPILSNLETGMLRAIQHLGTVEELTVYAPSTPGLLCTIEATATTHTHPPVRQSIRLQLGALEVPPLRAAVQVAGQLGQAQSGRESSVHVHWGDLKVGKDLVLEYVEDIPAKSTQATIMNQSDGEMTEGTDRWMEAWVGGSIHVTHVSSEDPPTFSYNVHQGQDPIPGVRFDRWDYEQLKRTAKRFGRYYAIDRDGLLYPQGLVEPGRGLSSDEVFRSQAPGDHQGLIFIDTLDQTAPRVDNLGTIHLRMPYIEGMVVVQGHVVFEPAGTGQPIQALSPPFESLDVKSRMSVQLTGVHFNGVLYAQGDMTVAGNVKLYGAVVAGGTIVPTGTGGRLDVWYDYDLGQGLYRGLPVVYRAPGTWQARY